MLVGYIYMTRKPNVNQQEEQERLDKLARERKHFTNMMNFSAEKAYGGK